MSTLRFNQIIGNSVGDFFHLPSNYDLRIAKYTNFHLQRQEGVKTRQIYGNLCSIANGVAFSVSSHGGSLIVCVFAARRLYVAIQKLCLIRKELLDRSLPLRPFLKRDWMIPVAVTLTAASISWGVNLGLEQLVPMGQFTLIPGANPDPMLGGVTNSQLTHHTAHAISHTANTVLDQSSRFTPTTIPTQGNLSVVAHHIGAATTGFETGAHDQVASLFSQPLQPIEVVTNINDPNYVAAHLGYSSGVAAAKVTEASVAAQLAAMSIHFGSDKVDLESLKKRNAQILACRRLPWSTRVVCQECVMPIENGIFYHSCDGNGSNEEDDDADDDEYDVCRSCYDNLKDHDFKTQLRAMFLAVPGDSFHPGLNAVTLIDLLGPKDLLCMACSKGVTHGWYYDCWDCRSSDKCWTFCQKCYREGGGCARNKEHRLFSFLRARIAQFNADTPYQKKVPRGTKETGRAACTNCHANIERGAYYHCAKCDKGKYDLCTRCHASEKHCLNSSHVLTKYYAWKYKRDYDIVSATQWKCSNPDCLNLPDADCGSEQHGEARKVEECAPESLDRSVDKRRFSVLTITTKEKTRKQINDKPVPRQRMKFNFFFSCREPACHNREYGLCPPCYFTDLTCPVKEHDMYKCYFVK